MRPLTAHGLPDDKDDAADARVADAQDSYRDAYASVRRVYGTVNVRLDRAYWIGQEADQVLRDAQDELKAVRKSGRPARRARRAEKSR